MNCITKSSHRSGTWGIPTRYPFCAFLACASILILGWNGALVCFGQPSRIADSPADKLVESPAGPDEFGGEVGPIPSIGSISPRPGSADVVAGPDFSHGENAVFHGHGEKVCASGCSISRHPTDRLTKREYLRLIDQLAADVDPPEHEPADSSFALDSLLFYGRQTSQLMKRYGTGNLSPATAESLKRELKYTHAKISIRVIDESGETRSWLTPTKVPLDRRHVFSMQTQRLQPLVISGTVKRVGRDHLWTRL